MTSPDTSATEVPLGPILVPVVPPPGFWQREISHFPLPLTPLSRRVHRQTDWIPRPSSPRT